MSDNDDYGYLSNNKIEESKSSSSRKAKTEEKPKKSSSSTPSSTSTISNQAPTTKADEVEKDIDNGRCGRMNWF